VSKVYVSDKQLAERYSVTRKTIWEWSAKGILPKPVRLSGDDGNCTRWRFDLIEQRDAEVERKSAAA
jgi:predicted DNA-binding transcriptional regulator AlpA